MMKMYTTTNYLIICLSGPSLTTLQNLYNTSMQWIDETPVPSNIKL